MTNLRARLHHLFAAVFALGLLGFGATDAQATHFRYGTLRWELAATQPSDPTLVRIKVTTESAWRRSFSWPNGQTPQINVPLATGQTVIVQNIATFGTVASAALNVTPSSINGTEDWFVGSMIAEFQFARTNLPVRIFFEGAARVSNLMDGNNDKNFRVEAIMSAAPNAASPAASILPIITVPYPAPGARFFIPATDVEGDPLSWRISDLARSSLAKLAPDGLQNNFVYMLSINSTTGEVTWRTDQELSPAPNGDYYAVQFIVSDNKGGETPVDALLRLIPAVGTAPVVLINGLASAYSVDVRPGSPVTFTVTGTDADAGATVTLTSGAIPAGSSMTPSLPTAGTAPRSSTFNWTPTLAQAGNTYPVSFAVTDNFGMQDTNSASIRVLANFPPTVSCPDATTVEADGPGGASSVTLQATVTDGDPDALTVKWFVNGVEVSTQTVQGPGTFQMSHTQAYAYVAGGPAHAIRVEVNDGFVSRDCTSSVTVVDTTAPALVVPTDIIEEATAPAGNAVSYAATATDIVDPNPTVGCTPASGSVFPVNGPAPSATTVVCTASDHAIPPNSVSASFTIRIQDTTPPVISNMPANIIEEATGPSGASASWAPPTALDIVDLGRAVTCAPASGSTFAFGTSTVTCSSSDTRGNTSSRTFTVTVRDTIAPVIANMPGDLVREATGPSGASVNWASPTATDVVDLDVQVTCAPASGSTFAITPSAPVATVTCTATDDSNNTSTATFTVTVRDTTPPVISGMPANIAAPATSPAGAIVSWPSPTALDIVDLVRTVTCVPASGTTFAFGTTIVSCSASDTRGNTSTRTFTVTVSDNVAPILNLPASQVLEATGPGGAIATWSPDPPTATDDVDGTISAVCTRAANTMFALGVTTVSCTATDSHNNSTTGSFTITVRDTIAPVIANMPGDLVREATGPSGASVSWASPTATDVVDLDVQVTCAPASGSTFAITPSAPVATVTCTATDDSNNTSTATFTVTVRDTTAPVISGMPADITVNATSPTGAIVAWTSPTAFDIVDLARTVTCVPASGSLFALGIHTVTCTAADTRGNSRSETFRVTVMDAIPPTVVVTLNPGVLWPPNHKMVNIRVTVATEPGAVCNITQVTSNEPVNDGGDGNTDFDWTFLRLRLQLRAERSGHGQNPVGRIYTVTVTCIDSSGNVGTGTATATVPHDMGGSTGSPNKQ